MDLGLKEKITVVLGASRGMGRACAWALAREGCSLALAARNEKLLASEAASIEKECSVVAFHKACDVTRDGDRASFIDAVIGRFKRVHILINNCAGPKPGSLNDLNDSKDWLEAFERSLLQVVKWTQAIVPHMKEWGR